MMILAILFFLTAVLYSSVGFGGGSTYTALLALYQVDYRAIPVISLLCNILVVSVGTLKFARAGHLNMGRSWPLFITSVPMALIGGMLQVSEMVFIGLLAVSLFAAGLAMLWRPAIDDEREDLSRHWLVEPVIGGTLGFVAGIVGIGGGIFLAPLLYMLHWGRPKSIAATCATFILVNSIAGLIGQASKGFQQFGAVVEQHAALFAMVLVGGFIGSTLGSRWIDPKWVRILTACLTLFVSVRLARQFVGTMP